MRAAVILDLDRYPRPLRALEAWFEALVVSNCQYLEDHPAMPALYAAGVVYASEGSPEVWRDIPTIYADGWGDCDDLACWLAAELRVKHKRRAIVSLRQRPGSSTVHAVVVDADAGVTHDPSRVLGMGRTRLRGVRNGQILRVPKARRSP